MNARQLRFVQEYLIDLNATQAAIRAGYSEKTAYVQGPRLLENVGVQDAIRFGQEKVLKKAEISAEMVLSGFRDIFERCMTRVPVMEFDRDAKCTRQKIDLDTGLGVWTFDAANANRALENLGKHLGLFVDRSEGKNTIEVRYLTDSADKPPDAGM